MSVKQSIECRELKIEHIKCDLAVVGGGLAGTCCAITAARAGIKVALIQDRPVLGGNASSEVRLWSLGATSHMGNNNRWAREGGVIDEIFVENTYRNKEGNPVIFDTVMLEKVINEPNITLLLNTVVFALDKKEQDAIKCVHAFCSQNSTMYDVYAPLFCDASGDGVVGFLSGAAFRMGAESKKEFGEKFAPDDNYGALLGHSIFFYTKDTGKPVKFVPPSYALKDITKIPRYRCFRAKEQGCELWWLEYGGRLDTIHETEAIKYKLWEVVYGVWNYIKNSGKFPEAETMTLEWVGNIPGKRESRRFEGDYMLIQQDLIEQHKHYDAVSFGGWAIDLHPADGVFSKESGCIQWHSKGVYQIPYRCFYSRNIKNLFLTGRIISVSHVAFGSTRVMATCAHNGQAVGMAAALCRRHKLLPHDISGEKQIHELQQKLLRTGQYIPCLKLNDSGNLAVKAKISATSQMRLSELADGGPLLKLNESWAMMLPVAAGAMPKVSFILDVDKPTALQMELRVSSSPENHTPDVTLSAKTVKLNIGKNQTVTADFDVTIDCPRYAFVCLMANEHITAHCSEQRLTGVLSVTNKFNGKVATSNCQNPPDDIGVEKFEFWLPLRRPKGHNLAIKIEPPINVFQPENIINGIGRPASNPNAWVSDFNDTKPGLTLSWPKPQTIGRIELTFDTDFDHPMESVQMGHSEDVMPFCVRRYRILDASGQEIYKKDDNYQTHNTISLNPPIKTNRITVELAAPSTEIPAAVFDVRCYENSGNA